MDTGAGSGSGVETLRSDRLLADLAESVDVGVDPAQGGVDIGEPHPRTVEESTGLSAFECNRLAFGIMLVVRGDIRRRRDDRRDLAGQHRDLLHRPGPIVSETSAEAITGHLIADTAVPHLTRLRRMPDHQGLLKQFTRGPLPDLPDGVLCQLGVCVIVSSNVRLAGVRVGKMTAALIATDPLGTPVTYAGTKVFMKRIIPAAAVGVGAVAAGAYFGRLRSVRSQVAVVTGGSRGLGLAIADELVRAGCRVAICARDGEELDRAVTGLRERGGDVLPVVCDVSVEDEARSLVEQVVGHFGAIDIVVNNAGIIQVGPLDALTTDNFRDAMDPMLWGMIHVTMAALPYLRAQRSGHICNITSIGGKIAVPHLMPYSTAKFAAVGFSEGLRTEVAADGIRVTTVVPGLMRTGSDVQAQFAGDAAAEYGWFAIGAATPVLSMDGQRAARRIVRAIRTRRTEVVLTPAAKAAVLAHGVAPALTQRILTVVDRFLPAAPTGRPGETEPGVTAAAGTPEAVQAATALNRGAGRKLNQPQPDA